MKTPPFYLLAFSTVLALEGALLIAPSGAQTATPLPMMTPPTVSSPTALVGWAAGPDVTAELEAEKTMMRVPSGDNAMEIERHLSSVPHRAGSAADHATALYVQQRLQNDGFATRIQEYQVEFTGP
ncbi:MAG: hypothetical protein WCB01_01185, partial [Candidatus Cybelea sp.]